MDRPTQDVGFRVMRCFNNPDIRHLAGNKGRIDERTLALMPRDSLRDVFALHCLMTGCFKEVCESRIFEHTTGDTRTDCCRSRSRSWPYRSFGIRKACGAGHLEYILPKAISEFKCVV